MKIQGPFFFVFAFVHVTVYTKHRYGVWDLPPIEQSAAQIIMFSPLRTDINCNLKL